MTNKDFREIQVSSTLLVVIFLGVLALGVFIFLLGVSVGKKQTVTTSAPTQLVTQQIPEPVKEPSAKPAESDPAAGGGTPQDKAAAPTSVQDAFASQPQAAPPSSTPPAPKTSTKPATTDKPAAAKTSPETKASPAAKTGLYYVQVAAFTDKGQAQVAADKYKKQGYTAVVWNPKPTDTKTWYRVRLGGYSTRDRAVNLLEKLNAAAGKKTDFRVVQD